MCLHLPYIPSIILLSGLLKQLLNFDHFVPVIMNANIWLEESEDTPTLQAQNPLPLLLKKVMYNILFYIRAH